MARRLLILAPLLISLALSPLFAVEIPLPPPPKAKKTTPATTEKAKEKAPAVNVLSIIPAQGEPGTTVTLHGSGFTPKTVVHLANREVSAEVIGPQQITFDIPAIEPGLYALFLKREDGATSRPYNFTILPVRPVVTYLSPDTIYVCASGSERDVTVAGENFLERSQVLLDGAAIKSRYVSSGALIFTVPQVGGGYHQVQVKNPQDTVSGTLGLVIDARPEITSVNKAEEYVSYYNLVVEGRNFQQNSTLVVMEEKSLEITPSQSAVDVKRIDTGAGNITEREQIIFVNCNRIIYQRRPYSSYPKNFNIQVVNPGSGGESSVVSVSAP